MTDREQTGGWESAGSWATDPASARVEAERLVATGMAAMAMAADRVGAPTRERGGAAAASFDAIGDMLFGPADHRRHSVANDSPECCKCPVCRVISAAREPSPELAEKVATGVGTLAEGAARALRTVAGVATAWQPPGPRTEPAGPWRDADPWAAATAEPAPAAVLPPAPATSEPAEDTRPAEPPAAKQVAKKKVAKKAVAKKAMADKTVAKQTAAKKVTKPAAKSTAKKNAGETAGRNGSSPERGSAGA